MMGQACHFSRYAAEDVPYGTWRYTAEARRLNHVLNQRLVSSFSGVFLNCRENGPKAPRRSSLGPNITLIFFTKLCSRRLHLGSR